MATDQIWEMSKTVLSVNFPVPGRKIIIEAGTVLEIIGFNETNFQCLVDNRFIISVPINLTEAK